MQCPRDYFNFSTFLHTSSTGIPNSVFYNDLTSSGPESIPSYFSSDIKSIYALNLQNNNDPIVDVLHNNCIFSVDDIEVVLVALKTLIPSYLMVFLVHFCSTLGQLNATFYDCY